MLPPFREVELTNRPLSSSFLGLPYRIPNISHKKELLRGLWVLSTLIEMTVRVNYIMGKHA